MMSLRKRILQAKACSLAGFMAGVTLAAAQDRPNILWITSEDHGPEMGCYGDTYAETPNVDHLAAQGMRYKMAWSTYPVCAPARTTIISGMYPMSTGAEHMRSRVPYPDTLSMYPQILREAGYYCTNKSKKDYNHYEPGKIWNESSLQAHWKNRSPGKPFFAIFNSNESHESRIRTEGAVPRHDPRQAPVPAYHPDTPTVRRDWALYYDTVTSADADAGVHLREIEDAGLMEDTIIFYYGDHGNGLPRGKRSAYNSGLQVPLIVYIPEKYKHLRPPEYETGGQSERLVGFVDLAPTLLSLAGIKPPEWMQGHAFLGEHIEPPQPFLFGGRGRMDERYDLVRSVTDGRFVYIRNYMPHRIPGQHVNYMWQTPTTREWERLHREGALALEQEAFWRPKPPEELYDLVNDPDEVHNLASSPDHAEIKARLQTAQQEQARHIRDVGFLPEGELFTRQLGASPYDFGSEDKIYPFERIFAMAETASMLDPDAVPELVTALDDADSAVRYWGALGLLMRGEQGVAAGRAALLKALEDSSPYVRIAAAEAIAAHDNNSRRQQALWILVVLADYRKHSPLASLAALNAMDALGELPGAIVDELRKLEAETEPVTWPYQDYPDRLIGWLVTKFSDESGD